MKSHMAMLALAAPFLLAQAAPTTRPAPPFTIAPDTTVITAPLRSDGTADYVAALHARFQQGVTPASNGFVRWLDIAGPHLAIPAELRGKFLDACGATPPASDGYPPLAIELHGTGLDQAAADQAAEDLTLAGHGPWPAERYPRITAYLAAREKQLDALAEVVARPHWYTPLVTYRHDRLMGALLPSLSLTREMGEALTARAMLRANAGDVAGAARDLQVARKFARQVIKSGGLLPQLVRCKIEERAAQGAAALAAGGTLSSAQVRELREAMAGLAPLEGAAANVDVMERWCVLDYVSAVATWDRKLMAEKIGSVGPGGRLADWDPARVLTLVDRGAVDWDVVLRRVNAHFDAAVVGHKTEDFREMVAAMARVRAEVEAGTKGAPVTLKRKDSDTRQAYSERVGAFIAGVMMPETGKAEVLCRRARFHGESLPVVLAAAEFKARERKWPDTLEQLVPALLPAVPVDPCAAGAGQPLRYSVTASRVRVYSVGQNGRDDGGENGPGKDDFVLGISGERQ